MKQGNAQLAADSTRDGRRYANDATRRNQNWLSRLGDYISLQERTPWIRIELRAQLRISPVRQRAPLAKSLARQNTKRQAECAKQQERCKTCTAKLKMP